MDLTRKLDKFLHGDNLGREQMAVLESNLNVLPSMRAQDQPFMFVRLNPFFILDTLGEKWK